MKISKLAVATGCVVALLCVLTAGWAVDRRSDGPDGQESRKATSGQLQGPRAGASRALDRRLAALEAQPVAPGAAPMKYGVAATPGDFNSGYLAQVKEYGATVGYFYGQDPRWSDVAAVPDDNDIWLQTKATTKAAYQRMLASFPRTRTGNVYLHYFNEPEDEIEGGEFTLAQWQQRTDWLYEAIKESGKSYVIPSVEIMYWDLLLTIKGTDRQARTVDNYLRPGVQAMGMSAFAHTKVSGGHQVASTSPVKMPEAIGAWSRQNGLPVSVITGWAVDQAHIGDPVTMANRVAWTKAVAALLSAEGIAHLMWFDADWSTGDYRLSQDPHLLETWRTLSRG